MSALDWVFVTFFGVPLICAAMDYWGGVGKEIAGALSALVRAYRERKGV